MRVSTGFVSPTALLRPLSTKYWKANDKILCCLKKYHRSEWESVYNFQASSNKPLVAFKVLWTLIIISGLIYNKQIQFQCNGNGEHNLPPLIIFSWTAALARTAVFFTGNSLQSYTAVPRCLPFTIMIGWERNLKPETKISQQLSHSSCTQTAITNDEAIKEM